MSAAERVACRVEVTGQVQGVFFRETARREAARLGVAGWVTNRPDGAVEAVFEGDPDAVEAMVGWARHGPVHARVDDVAVRDEPVGRLAGFTVRAAAPPSARAPDANGPAHPEVDGAESAAARAGQPSERRWPG